MSKPTPGTAMPPLKHSLALYGAGHGALLAGALAMHLSDSMLPMALAASACLMLTVPLVRHFLAAASRR